MNGGRVGVALGMSLEVSEKTKQRSVQQAVHDLKTDASLLIRQEIALAKAEVKEKITAVAKQAAFFAGAGVLGYTGLLVLLAALVLGLIALGVVAWLAALSVAIVIFLSAFVLVQRARNVSKKPEASA